MRQSTWIGFLALTAAALLAAPAQGSAPELTTAAEAVRAARAQDRPVEVTAQATELRKVRANPDGSFEAELFAEPVQVERGGVWVAIDTDLERRADGSIAPKAIAGELTLSRGGAQPLARFASRGQSVELDWPGALPEPTIDGDTATYADVRPGVDLQVRATATGFAPRFIVTRPTAAARLTLGQEIDTGGKEPAIDVGDAVVSDGERRVNVPAPMSADEVRLRLDPELMATASATNPLVIAPPDYNRPIGQTGWAKVMSGPRFANQSFWGGGTDGGEAKVGYCGWDWCNGIGVLRSYFQYDHGGFLFGKTIISAEFNALNFYSPACNRPRWISLWQTHPIGSGTTWNNQPWHTREWGGNHNFGWGYNSTCPGRNIGWDLTTAVRNRVNAGWTVFTYALAADVETDRDAWRKFTSNPSLIVHYNTPPTVDGEGADGRDCAVQPNEPYTTTTTPQLRARVNDADGGLVEAGFEWFVRFGGQVGGTTTAERSQGSTFTADIPPGAFADGARIAYRVRGFDGRDWGPYGRWCDITVDTTAPGMPTVSSTDYPAGEESGAPGVTGRFQLRKHPGDGDVAGFRYSFSNPPDRYVAAAADGTATASITPQDANPKTLFVQAVDRAGNRGPIREDYRFFVGVPDPKPDAHLRLDGHHTAASAPDASGHGRHGTLTPGAAWTEGRVRDGVRLGGAGAFVRGSGGPPVRTDRSFTVSAWAKVDASQPHNRTAVSVDGRRVSGFYLQHNRDHGWSFVMTHADVDNPYTARAGGRAPTGRWTHVAGVYDAGSQEIRLYLDGALAGTSPHGSVWPADGDLQVGRAKWNGTEADHFAGAIDDVRLYQRALPQGEIGALAGRPVNDEGRWMLDEGSGTTAADASGAFRHATATAGATWVEGQVGGAVQLNGAAALGTAGPAVRTDASFTVSAWVRADRFEPGIMRTAVSQDGMEKSAFLLGYRGDAGRWSFLMPGVDAGAGNVAIAASSVTPETGAWTHLTGVYDLAARELRIYVNGRPTGSGPLPPGWSPWHAGGPLRIGRAKWAGGESDHWPGAIDDVRVFEGVRDDRDILNEFRRPPAAPQTPYSGAIARYRNHAGEHLTASGPVPRGYQLEGPFGLPAPAGAPNTRPLYTCAYHADTFTSTQASCEGYPRLGVLGHVYVDPEPGVHVRPLYRCVVTAGGEHFETVGPECEGQTREWLLGYVRASIPLVAHEQPDPPGERRSSPGALPSTYEPVRRLGFLPLVRDDGMRSIFACVQGADHYTSVADTCDGGQLVSHVGYVWTDPPEVEAALLVRCGDAETGERYDAVEDCGEDELQDTLGYLPVAP